MIFNTNLFKETNINGKITYNRIYIPNNNINIIEEIDKDTCKINGRLVKHKFDEIITNIEIDK